MVISRSASCTDKDKPRWKHRKYLKEFRRVAFGYKGRFLKQLRYLSVKPHTVNILNLAEGLIYQFLCHI